VKNNLMQRGPVSNLSSGNLHSKPIASAKLDHEVMTFMNYWQKMNSAVTVPHIFGKLDELSYISNLEETRRILEIYLLLLHPILMPLILQLQTRMQL
jgi:hypothetical protein